MKYTPRLITDFLDHLLALDKDYRTILAKERQIYQDSQKELDDDSYELLVNVFESLDIVGTPIDVLLTDQGEAYRSLVTQKVEDLQGSYKHLQECKILEALICTCESSIVDFNEYERIGKAHTNAERITISDVLQQEYRFIALAFQINEAFMNGKKKELGEKCSELYILCREAEKLLEDEIKKTRAFLAESNQKITYSIEETTFVYEQDFKENWEELFTSLDTINNKFFEDKVSSIKRSKKHIDHSLQKNRKKIEELTNDFCKKFPPEELRAEYINIYSREPSFGKYECAKEMPYCVPVGTIEIDIKKHKLCNFVKEFLDKHYYYIYKNDKLIIPQAVEFGTDFNFLFEYNGYEHSAVTQDACDFGMRLFMMMPPGKVNFLFADPVHLGENFAQFMQLVDTDDRTSEIVNGKIWSSPSDIESKLRVMTNHISNVTQRCLQGKFKNIFEYNKVAEQNAEAYQIIMLMDYPAGLTEQSLKLLEQIVKSGPKCGVFTLIFRNQSQYESIQERMKPLVKSIEEGFKYIRYSDDTKCFLHSGDQKYQWKKARMPDSEQMDRVISTLRKGLKSADKVVIDIEKVNNAEITKTTKDGIRIPIGIHGANEVQYLTLGVGSSHHALIAGLTRSGKSSLLHTIIMRALTQYESPDELSIYLVDFKRGVEFKTYADYILPMFKVIAVETEREFGFNILEALEREQKIRADLFKRNHVDKIQEYRDLPNYDKMTKMPRIVLIMDEFHELFSNENDEMGKKASIIMERIVRQGAAFGIHLILASQSYTNITSLNKAVFDQMAVRIVLKCSKADANMLLDNGSTEIDQISIDDPGRAVYNSEAGNKEYNSHFRVAYIEPEKHRAMLQEISESTKQFADAKQPTRILLSNIEDNNYSIFNQFSTIDPETYKTPGRLYIGEPLSISNNMSMDFSRNEHSNLLMIGGDTEKARSMFAFSILSLCINYKIAHQQAPEKPFIYLFNCKPLDDSYFKDTPKLLAEFLPEYIQYFGCGDTSEIQSIVSQMYEDLSNGANSIDTDKYFFVFGYQRAEALKSEIQLSQSEDIDSLFNIIPSSSSRSRLSLKEMFRSVVKDGAQKGVHTLIWQDSFNALYQDDKDIMSYFSMKIAFDMSPEEYSRFVIANDVSLMSENNAIYYNRARDNQKFRPYQSPAEDWLKNISDKLK